ncbi:MAG: tRNA (adenosine(37)-N6)-threonylcarbamoyltransferase complex dimerization subunit type 1 TsaB [Lachnospirales bacterium]
MKILALDTTGLVASVALVDENKTIAEFTTNFKKTHSQTIMPMLDELCKTVELNLNDIDYIACACGPGSFTGLRIGAATAKGLAHGLDKKIIPVPTLDGLAYNLMYSNMVVVPIMDARRNQVYTALYDTSEGFKRISDYMACDIYELIDIIKEKNYNPVFLGDGVPVFYDIIKENGYCVAPVCANMQSASCIGAAALNKINEAVSCNDFEIIYLRKSQAERELEEKNKNAN